MNVKELKEIIFKPASNLMRKSGEDIFKKGLVSSVRGKKIDNMYIVYGDVVNNVKQDELKTYIKINLANKRLEEVRCSCEDFKELSQYKSMFMCEHLTATAYKFLHLLYKKNEKGRESSNKVSTDNPQKVGLDFDIYLACKSLQNKIQYEVEFRIGVGHKHLITDLRGFIRAFENKESIFFNNQFAYNPKEHRITTESMKIIDYIKLYSNRNSSIVGRYLIISSKDLRIFLEVLGERKIKFKFKGIEYESSILRKNLPIKFTIKEKNNHFVLAAHKKRPIPLNSLRDVYFLDNHIYISPLEQLKEYNFLRSKFNEQGEIFFNRTMADYKRIISLIKGISEEVILSESVKSFISNAVNFELFFYIEDSVTNCIIYAVYNGRKINILEKDEVNIQIVRDISREEKAIIKLESLGFKRAKDKFEFIGSEEELFRIVNGDEKILSSIGTINFGKGIKDINIIRGSDIEVDFIDNGENLKLNYKIGDIDRAELNDIFKSFKDNNKFYSGKNNYFIDFQDEGIKRFFNLIEIIEEEKNIHDGSIQVDKNKAVYLLEGTRNNSFKLGNGVNLLKDIENKLGNIDKLKYPLPNKLKANLRDYQVDGFIWFKNTSYLGFGGILADEMGLGKTVQAIAFLTSEEKKKSLIITPASLIYNWKNEIDKFAPSLKTAIAHGNGLDLNSVIDKYNEYDLILTTYGTLRNNTESFCSINFDYCIIDEAQNIKNPTTQIAISVKKIIAKVKFALTGTPIENNLIELWSIFDFIMPGYLYSKDIFEKKFIANGEDKTKDIKTLIKPFILRRTKNEVIKDLPDKIENTIFIDMPPEQRNIYDSFIKEVKEKIKNTGNKIEIFTYLTRLRQICLDPALILKNYQGGSGKIEFAIELIEDQVALKGKLLLFSQFTSALKNIGEILKEKNINFLYLDGSISSKERIRLVNEFNNNDNIRIFLISLKAGGTGLNLTSANMVIHFDPWWNPAVENQATDRAHRIGQRNVVEVVKLVASRTIEEKIILLQENKRELIDNIITGELKSSEALNKLTRDELIEIFDKS